MPLVPCIDCGEIADQTRCLPCRGRASTLRSRERRRDGDVYDRRWRRLSARARRLQPWCSTCHTTEDLTTDHKVAIAAGGPTTRLRLADVDVLCRRCNAAKGARR